MPRRWNLSCRMRRSRSPRPRSGCRSCPAQQTRVWSYEGQLLSGSGVTVQNLPGSYLGPILRVKAARRCASFSTTTWPKTASSTRMACACRRTAMGSRCRPLGRAQTKVYEFQVIDRAGPDWFHPHPHMRTAEQVYDGPGRAVLRLGCGGRAGGARRQHRGERRAGDHPGPQSSTATTSSCTSRT